MLSISSSFYFMVAACILAAVWCAKRNGKHAALGAGMAISLLAGTWFQLGSKYLPVHVPSAVAIILLVCMTYHSGRRIWSPLTLLDCVIGAIAIWHVVVDVHHGAGALETSARSYGEWIIPYVAGRYAVYHRGALALMAPWFVSVAAVIAFAAVFESVFDINLWETLFTEVDDLVKRVSGKRYNLAYRAIGPTRHPIFLGVLFLLLAPWSIVCLESTSSRSVRASAIAAAFLSVLGILATVSRGPLLALVPAIGFAVAIHYRWTRWIVCGFAVVLASVVVLHWDQALDLVAHNINENRKQIVEVNGEEKVYDAARNRIYVYEIYGPFVVEGGPLGYGTRQSAGFPPGIPGIPSHVRNHDQLRLVDNSFLLIGLRFGWVGVFLLAGLFSSAIVTALSLRRTASTFLQPAGPLSVTAFSASMLAVALEVSTVFFSYDFAFWVLFHCGLISGLASYSKSRLRSGVE